MPDNIVIPAWVWWFAIKAVAITIFSIGLIVVAVFWKTGRLPFSGARVYGEKSKHDRRMHDDLIERLIDQNESQNKMFMVAYQENAGAMNGTLNAIRALAQEIAVLAGMQKDTGGSLHAAIERIHDRIDGIREVMSK